MGFITNSCFARAKSEGVRFTGKKIVKALPGHRLEVNGKDQIKKGLWKTNSDRLADKILKVLYIISQAVKKFLLCKKKKPNQKN